MDASRRGALRPSGAVFLICLGTIAETEKHARRNAKDRPTTERGDEHEQRDHPRQAGMDGGALGERLAEAEAEGRQSGEGEAAQGEQEAEMRRVAALAEQLELVDVPVAIKEHSAEQEKGSFHAGMAGDVNGGSRRSVLAQQAEGADEEADMCDR